jgi:Tfp pilus assembly protein PilX
MTGRLKLQQGATLLVTLVMLVVLTLFVISAMKISGMGLGIVGNMQAREEAIAAGQQAIEQVMSNNFTAAPTAQTISVDINNDGDTEYTVEVATPTCISSKPLLNSDLNPADPADYPCFGSIAGQNTGILNPSGSTTGASQQSWCSLQQWDIEATVTDTRTGAEAVQHQGAALRVGAGTACS